MIVIIDENINKDQNDLLLDLKNRGLECSVYYPHPIPRLKYYNNKYGYDEKSFKNSEIISDKSITLPIGPHLTDNDLDKIVNLLSETLQ